MVEVNLDLLGFEILVDLFDQKTHDLDQVVIGERHEENDVVEAIEEFGIEGPFHFAADLIFHLGRLAFELRGLETQVTALFQESRAEVRGHDDDCVLEIDLVAEAVGQLPVFKTCSRMLKISGCAFSISSSRMMEYGERLTRSVNWPPSS